MNTFSNADAKTSYFRDKTHYLALKAAWAKAFHTKTLDSRHMMLYAWLRGKDIRSAFTPTTNANKLNNGHAYDYGISTAYWGLYRLANQPAELKTFLEVFGGELDEETFSKAFNDMPKMNSTPYHTAERIKKKLLDWKSISVEERAKAHIHAIENNLGSAYWYIIETEIEAEQKAAEEKMLARKATTVAAPPKPVEQKGFFGRMFS